MNEPKTLHCLWCGAETIPRVVMSPVSVVMSPVRPDDRVAVALQCQNCHACSPPGINTSVAEATRIAWSNARYHAEAQGPGTTKKDVRARYQHTSRELRHVADLLDLLNKETDNTGLCSGFIHVYWCDRLMGIIRQLELGSLESEWAYEPVAKPPADEEDE